MSPYEFAGKVRGEENERNDEFYCNTRTTFRGALAKWLVPEGNRWGKNLGILGKLGPRVILFCEELISITLYQRAPWGSVWSAVPVRAVFFSFLQSHLIFTFFWFDLSAYVLKRKQWEEEESQMLTGGERVTCCLWFWQDSHTLLRWNYLNIFCIKIFIIVALVSVARYISRCFCVHFPF